MTINKVVRALNFFPNFIEVQLPGRLMAFIIMQYTHLHRLLILMPSAIIYQIAGIRLGIIASIMAHMTHNLLLKALQHDLFKRGI